MTGTEGRQWPRARYADLHLSAEYIETDGASHWGLTLNRRALAALLPSVVGWLEQLVDGESTITQSDSVSVRVMPETPLSS